MQMTRRLALISCGACFVIFLGTREAFSQHPIDEALASTYAELKADPDLQDEQSRHRKLMEMADQYSQFAEAAFQATADLQDYAMKVRMTGLVFRTPLAKIKEFDKGLKRYTEHPAFKGFQKYAAVKGHASTVLGLRDRLATTFNNPDLPPSARNSLMLLQTAGTGLEQLGEIPLAGPALEGYGKILSGLTDVMNNLAGEAAISTKEGVFSRTEEIERLQELDPKAQYVKTPLWHRGIPLVQEYPFAAGQDRYYLQMPNGTWIGVPDYDAVASVAADYYLTKKKNPDAQTLWKYYNDPDEREKLAFWAETELEFRRVEEILGDLPGVDRTTRYTQFTETEERIKRWHKSLGLPLEYDALNRLIRIEVANPGGVARALRARVLRAYPGFGEYLASASEDPQALEMDALIERFEKYRGGENLIQADQGKPVAADTPTLDKELNASCFIHIPEDLPAGWWHAKTNRIDGIPKPHGDGKRMWKQEIQISCDQGFVYQDNRYGGVYVDPRGSHVRRFSYTRVAIQIEPPKHDPDAEQSLQRRVDEHAARPGARYLTPDKRSAIYSRTESSGKNRYIQLVCVYRGCWIWLQLTTQPGTNSEATEDSAEHFARCICRHLD